MTMFKLFDYQQELVKQARISLAEGHKGVLIVSPPGSGKSVIIAEIARLTALKHGHVLFFVHRKELVNQIKESFKQQEVDLSRCTIMTVGKVANRLGKLPKPNLIIVDESQHSRAKTYLKIFDYYSDVPRLGFTGSPWRLSGKGFDDIYSKMIEGPNVKWLIEHKKLAPFTLYGYRLGDESVLKKGSTGDYTNNSLDDFGKSIIRGDIIKSWKKFADNRKTIVYCHSIQFAKEVAKSFKEAGIVAYEVDSKTPSNEREKIMNDFKTGKIKIICNCDLISEGFNVPDCSCVVLLRPTQSLVLYLQQSMRCMRYQKDKQAIIIDQVGNFSRFGLPDAPRKWSLKDRAKKVRENNTQDSFPIKTCPQCFGVIQLKYRACPLCGYTFEAEFKKLEQDKLAKLEKINAAAKEKRERKQKEKEILLRDPSSLSSFKELSLYGKARGYKPGWAYHQAKLKGFIK